MIFLSFVCVLYQFIPFASAESVSFTEVTIAGSHNDAYGVCSGDIDGDGYKDFVACGYNDDGKLSWYESNDDYTSFTEHLIENRNGHFKVELMDADLDGDLEIITTQYPDDAVHIFYHSGDPTGSWTKGTVTNLVDPGYHMNLSDFNDDGYMDIVTNSPYGGTIYWCKNNGDYTFTTYSVGGASGVRGVHSGDIDMDGDPDVVGGLGGGTNDVKWWENNGNPTSSWSSHVIDSSSPASPSSVFVGDIDGDGVNDVACAGLDDGQLVWYENVNGCIG